MPIPTPFHERTHSLCYSMRWKEWGGYYAVCSYDLHHDREYFAFRHAVGIIDVTPLFKYDVTGPEAGKFLARVMVKDVRKLKDDQVTYLCWCDDEGKVIDDGTVTKFSEDHYRVTAAEPTLSWFLRYSRNYDVKIEDITEKVAALAVQGPNSRELLKACSDAPMDSLKFFRGTKANIEGIEAYISRTGYTGDLGYEVWCKSEEGVRLWDILMKKGHPFGVEACGLDALDVCRLEAGFIMNGVDYFSANHCMIESRKSTPYELNLDWCVKLDREPFIGQEALRKEKEQGSDWATVGLDINWTDTEKLYDEFGLPPQVCSSPWRSGIPVYNKFEKQVGYATSGTFSPTLKKNIALATLEKEASAVGTELLIEMTAEFRRRTVRAKIVPLPFFNPERKRFTPGG